MHAKTFRTKIQIQKLIKYVRSHFCLKLFVRLLQLVVTPHVDHPDEAFCDLGPRQQ